MNLIVFHLVLRASPGKLASLVVGLTGKHSFKLLPLHLGMDNSFKIWVLGGRQQCLYSKWLLHGISRS